VLVLLHAAEAIVENGDVLAMNRQASRDGRYTASWFSLENCPKVLVGRKVKKFNGGFSEVYVQGA
jgi:hypothetical protein